DPRSVALTIGMARGGRKRTWAPPVPALAAAAAFAAAVAVLGGVIVPHEAGQALGLVGHEQRLDELVEVASQHARQVMHGLADAVVRDAVLRVVVRPDLVAPVARADHRPPSRRIRRTLLLDLEIEQARPQHGQRLGLVLVLALLVLD